MTSFPSTPGPTFNPDSSFLNKPPNQAESKAGSLRHVTIKQVLKAKHEETHFKIGNQVAHHLVILANVYDVTYRGGKLSYGLDDGTGRMKAYSWVTDDKDAERAVAEYEAHPFAFARVIGKISEFNRIYSIDLVKISRVVEDPHEIYHHLLKSMVESVMYVQGPPERKAVEKASQLAKVNYPPPVAVTTKPLRTEATSGPPEVTEETPGPTSPPRTPSPEPLQPPQRVPASVGPPTQPPPVTPSNPPQSNTVPRRRNYRIGGDFSSPGPSNEPDLSPLQTRPRQSSRPSLAPTRLRSPSGPSPASTAALSHQLASPEFVSPIASPPPSPTRSRPKPPSRNGEDTRMFSPLPWESRGDATPDVQTTPAAKKRTPDPYSHLSNLQRDIILTIQNLLSTTENMGQGVSITVVVKSVARRRPGINDAQFDDAFTYLLEEGYLYNTIDETFVACTEI
ncbi:hypothetical protein AN958_09489 [Leucoagaricus sp. SymC.cos]|nr:hypothetical protein AN958_09489 [Leucoagaricus sp. SymC.cos]